MSKDAFCGCLKMSCCASFDNGGPWSRRWNRQSWIFCWMSRGSCSCTLVIVFPVGGCDSVIKVLHTGCIQGLAFVDISFNAFLEDQRPMRFKLIMSVPLSASIVAAVRRKEWLVRPSMNVSSYPRRLPQSLGNWLTFLSPRFWDRFLLLMFIFFRKRSSSLTFLSNWLKYISNK